MGSRSKSNVKGTVLAAVVKYCKDRMAHVKAMQAIESTVPVSASEKAACVSSRVRAGTYDAANNGESAA